MIQQICCGALYGSHTQRCDLNTADRLACYCCGGTFPSHWCCLWSPKGSRCFPCEPHGEPCRRALRCRLEQGSEQTLTVELGTWPSDDPRRAFVAGAAWWEFEKTGGGGTMWPSDRDLAEEEAERRYPGGKPRDIA